MMANNCRMIDGLASIDSRIGRNTRKTRRCTFRGSPLKGEDTLVLSSVSPNVKNNVSDLFLIVSMKACELLATCKMLIS